MNIILQCLTSLHADDWRPARGALEPRDVYFHIDEARRAHRPGHHARSIIKIPRDRTGPHESPAGPQEPHHLRVDAVEGLHAVEAVQAVDDVYARIGQRQGLRDAAAGDGQRAVLGNIANSYHKLGQHEQAVCMRREVYTRSLKLFGEGHKETLVEVNNYAADLFELRRFDEAKSLLRKAIPVARRALGNSNENTLRLRWNYARALCNDPSATPDDLREAVTRLEELAPYARRILGGTHPGTTVIELSLRDAQAALRTAEQS